MKGSQWIVVVVLLVVVGAVAYQAGRGGGASAPPEPPQPPSQPAQAAGDPAEGEQGAAAPSHAKAPAAPLPHPPTPGAAAADEAAVEETGSDLVIGLNADLKKVLGIAMATAGGEEALEKALAGARVGVQVFGVGAKTLGTATRAADGGFALALQRPEVRLVVDRTRCHAERAGAVVPCAPRRGQFVRAMQIALDASLLLPLASDAYTVDKLTAVAAGADDAPLNSLNFKTTAHGKDELAVEVRLDPRDQSLIGVTVTGVIDDYYGGFPRLELTASRYATIAGVRMPTEWRIRNGTEGLEGGSGEVLSWSTYPAFRVLDGEATSAATAPLPAPKGSAALTTASAPSGFMAISGPVQGGSAGIVQAAIGLSERITGHLDFFFANPVVRFGAGGDAAGMRMSFAVVPDTRRAEDFTWGAPTWARRVVTTGLAGLQAEVGKTLQEARADGLAVAGDARPVVQFLYEDTDPKAAMPVAIWVPLAR